MQLNKACIGYNAYVPSSSSPDPEINKSGEILRFLNSLQTDNAVPTETACNVTLREQ